MICLLFVNLYKREQNTESKSFQNGWSLKEPVLEALRLLFTLKNRVLFRQSGRGGGQNCREDGELEGMLISENADGYPCQWLPLLAGRTGDTLGQAKLGVMNKQVTRIQFHSTPRILSLDSPYVI